MVSRVRGVSPRKSQPAIKDKAIQKQIIMVHNLGEMYKNHGNRVHVLDRRCLIIDQMPHDH